MAMTKKHYEIVCKVLRTYSDTENYYMKTTTQAIAQAMATLFEVEDDKFNKEKFLKECGL